MPQSGFEDGFTVTNSGSLDIWVKELHAKVPGAIEGYIYDQLKLAISDFFQRTAAWRTSIGPIICPANDGRYDFNPVDAFSDVIQVLRVYRKGTDLMPIPATGIYDSQETSTSNVPSRYFVNPYHVLHLKPTPAVDITDVYADVALTPRFRDDNKIADWIVTRFYEPIKAGALVRLYEEPDKMYSNRDLAEYWGEKYRSEIARARIIGFDNFKNGPHPWQFNRGNM